MPPSLHSQYKTNASIFYGLYQTDQSHECAIILQKKYIWTITDHVTRFEKKDVLSIKSMYDNILICFKEGNIVLNAQFEKLFTLNMVSKYQNLMQLNCKGDIIYRHGSVNNVMLSCQFDIDRLIIRDQNYKVLCDIAYAQIQEIVLLKQTVQLRTHFKDQNLNVCAMSFHQVDSNSVYIKLLRFVQKHIKLLVNVKAEVDDIALTIESAVLNTEMPDSQFQQFSLFDQIFTSNALGAFLGHTSSPDYFSEFQMIKNTQNQTATSQNITESPQKTSPQNKRVQYPKEAVQGYGILKLGFDDAQSKESVKQSLQKADLRPVSPREDLAAQETDEYIANLRFKISKYEKKEDQIISTVNSQLTELTEYSQ